MVDLNRDEYLMETVASGKWAVRIRVSKIVEGIPRDMVEGDL